MIKPEQVPKGSAKAVHELFEPGYLESIGLHPEAIIAAALNAWPGMNAKAATDHVMLLNSTPALILPLMEKTDGE